MVSFRDPQSLPAKAGTTGVGGHIQFFNMGVGIRTQAIKLAEQVLFITFPVGRSGFLSDIRRRCQELESEDWSEGVACLEERPWEIHTVLLLSLLLPSPSFSSLPPHLFPDYHTVNS